MSSSATSASRLRPPSAVERATGLVRERAWTLAIWTAMFAWTVLLSIVVRGAYVDFRLGRFDLGNMVQAVWSTTQGRPLEATHSTGDQMTRLGGHVDPFLMLLAPVWALWPSPLSLAFAQIAVVSLGALPVLWLGRRHLGSERAAGLLALVYLAYPWIATSATGAIHPVTFSITFYLFCIWFLDTDRLLPFLIFALLAMSTGELMGLPVLGLGLWYALARARRAEGVLIALLGGVWTAFAVYVVVPHFSGKNSIFYGFYDQVGGSPVGVARTLVSDPATILRALTESHDVIYLVWLGLPLLFLFALSPWLALVGIPQLLANWLSDFRSMTDPRYHSVAAVIPFLIAAAVFGVARLREDRRVPAAASMLVVSATLAIVIGPWARALGGTPLGGVDFVPVEKSAALRDAIALVPDNAPVTASNPAGAHLSARRYVYSVPLLLGAEWVVLDLDDPWIVRPGSPILTNHPEVVHGLARKLAREPTWRKVFERDRVLVFHRVAP